MKSGHKMVGRGRKRLILTVAPITGLVAVLEDRIAHPEKYHDIDTEAFRCKNEGCRKPMCLTCGWCSAKCEHNNPA